MNALADPLRMNALADPLRMNALADPLRMNALADPLRMNALADPLRMNVLLVSDVFQDSVQQNFMKLYSICCPYWLLDSNASGHLIILMNSRCIMK
ncbi:hypothetical protein HNY73_001771 [Argiope bruennichi]|uniref:Uncharacterized protein n=1 Tax=Argiope bruennichi TaxID=94029 RepID=A0A8T0FSE7_ARGBR|nr:hypothetical protein HNY73_001771 [Argiope bruennichi]